MFTRANYVIIFEGITNKLYTMWGEWKMTDREKQLFYKYAFSGDLHDSTMEKIVGSGIQDSYNKVNDENASCIQKIKQSLNTQYEEAETLVYDSIHPKPQGNDTNPQKQNKNLLLAKLLHRIKSKSIKNDIEDYELQLRLYSHMIENREKDGSKEVARIPDSLKNLIELTHTEIESQHDRKAQIEARGGYLLAAWGIVLTITDSDMFYDHIFVTLLAVVSVIFCIFSLNVIPHLHYRLESTKNNYTSIIDSDELFYIRILYGLTNVWKYNNKKLKAKALCLSLAIDFTLIYTISIIYLKCLM